MAEGKLKKVSDQGLRQRRGSAPDNAAAITEKRLEAERQREAEARAALEEEDRYSKEWRHEYKLQEMEKGARTLWNRLSLQAAEIGKKRLHSQVRRPCTPCCCTRTT